MNAFEIAMFRIDGINPADRLPALVDRDREIFKAGMVYAGDIAEVGTSKTPEPISRHSIRMRIAKMIDERASELEAEKTVKLSREVKRMKEPEARTHGYRCPDCGEPMNESRGDYYCPDCLLKESTPCGRVDHELPPV